MDTREVIGLSNSHGQKRSADDNLDTEQRLTKRFNLLNIGTAAYDLLPSVIINVFTRKRRQALYPRGAPSTPTYPPTA